MVNFTFNSAVVSVKSQQVWGLGFSYSAFKENHFSCKSSNNWQSVSYLVEACLSGEIYPLQENNLNSNVIFVQFSFSHALNLWWHMQISKSHVIFMRSRYTTAHVFYTLPYVINMHVENHPWDSKTNFSTFQHMHMIIPHHLVCCNSV